MIKKKNVGVLHPAAPYLICLDGSLVDVTHPLQCVIGLFDVAPEGLHGRRLAQESTHVFLGYGALKASADLFFPEF